MKILVVFYSRTNTTKQVAQAIAQNLNCDVEEIFDTKNRLGALGYLQAGRDAMKSKLTKLKPLKLNPADYDLTIIGGPVWSFSLSTPIRTFLTQNADQLKKTAFFCTQGGNGAERAFRQMEKIIGKKPIADIILTTKEVAGKNYNEKIINFIETIKKQITV